MSDVPHDGLGPSETGPGERATSSGASTCTTAPVWDNTLPVAPTSHVESEKHTDPRFVAASTPAATPLAPNEQNRDQLLMMPELAPFAHLTEDERQVLETQLHSPTTQVSYLDLYRFADARDVTITIVSVLCAIAAGAALPLLSVRTLPHRRTLSLAKTDKGEDSQTSEKFYNDTGYLAK